LYMQDMTWHGYTGSQNTLDTSESVVSDTRYWLSAVVQTNKVEIYVDALSKVSLNVSTDAKNTGNHGGQPFTVGRVAKESGSYFDGVIDEVRVIKKALDASWIKTEYNNQSDPGTFFKSVTS